jgi:hypothetical protein
MANMPNVPIDAVKWFWHTHACHQHSPDPDAEAQRAARITAPLFQMTARKVARACARTDSQHAQNDHGGALTAAGLVRHARRLCPGSDQHKADRFAAKRGRFDPQIIARARALAGPRDSGIGGRERCPQWLGLMKLRQVQPRHREQARPVRSELRAHGSEFWCERGGYFHRGPALSLRRREPLRRDCLEPSQPSFMVKLDRNHP